ncbi:sensor histidine kinase [Polyangium aurulentum]|uniref:sensor histidine kinase n=1 Tax=Polyangium aurulentum TaxID=2567896 RepID=UPI00200ECB57|nr:sensor histidine kinase [Polyangium aurulentum]UQA61648.1 sensor histidine kinase [Polyangium aurulentum]
MFLSSRRARGLALVTSAAGSAIVCGGASVLTIKHVIHDNRDQILERWAEAAGRSASARGLSRPELMNIMPVYLDSLAEPDKPNPGTHQLELVESHLSSRVRQGFDLSEIKAEFSLLGRCILRVWTDVPSEDRPQVGDLETILATVDTSAILIVDMFLQHLIEDAQAEKRYFRFLRQALTASPPGEPSKTLPQRLPAAVSVLMEAMGAATAAILLHDPVRDEFVMTASAGLADEHLEHCTRSLASISFAKLVASRSEPTSVLDVESTDLDVPDALRNSGIRSLLGVRLPLERELVGVMYVGLRERRPFSARERRRMEALGEHVGLLIQNAQLSAALEQQIETLNSTQQTRDVLVSLLAHDLRGPISSARLSAEMLHRRDGRLKAGDMERATSLIIRSLDRAERLASDMLDTQRLHGGQRLPLTRVRCDLGVLVREVVDEMSEELRDRFVVVTPPAPVLGNWGARELRRALWNLLTNAIKYGAPESPVRITLGVLPAGVNVDIHNEGAPIPPEDQATLFDPFARAPGAPEGPGGWGLGLAVVRGVAEAHGGSAVVDSGPDRGTTFTLQIPFQGNA